MGGVRKRSRKRERERERGKEGERKRNRAREEIHKTFGLRQFEVAADAVRNPEFRQKANIYYFSFISYVSLHGIRNYQQFFVLSGANDSR